MSYFRESHGGVPTGWQTVNDNAKYERLSSRAPKTVSSDVEMRSPNALDGSDDSGSEEASSEQADSVTRMADESSEGSDGPAPAPKGSVSSTVAVSPLTRSVWYILLTTRPGQVLGHFSKGSQCRSPWQEQEDEG